MHAGIVARLEFARGVVAVHVAWLRVAHGGGVGANEDVARGTVGGGGLGDVAVRYGYQRFRPDIMIYTVIILIVMVQLIQIS